MLDMFLISVAVFALVIAGMAVGVIFSNRRIQGSCGGLANMTDRVGRPMCDCGLEPGECGLPAPRGSAAGAATEKS